jgi:hypothetical protein
VTKDSQPQGMAELLALQRAGYPLTPSEAARQRRSGRVARAAASAGAGSPADSPPADSPPAEAGLSGVIGQPGAASQPARPDSRGRIPGPVRFAYSRVAGNRNALLAGACAAVVALACYLLASRRPGNATGRRAA